jgi:D-alanyl-D-alanine carboxypeptidase
MGQAMKPLCGPTRSWRQILVVATLLLLVWGFSSCGGGSVLSSTQSCPSLPGPASSGIGSIVDGLVANEMKAQGLVGMSVAIAKKGKILYTQGYGYADLSTCQPVQPATEFQIGSITKQFTAAAVLRLWNAGALSIDAPVVAYLGSYGFDPRITLRMLLNQTSGLQDYLGFPAVNSWIGGVSQQTVLSQIGSAPLQFTPGTAYAYSNSNYFVLGSIIEAVGSTTYAGFIKANVFRPAALSNTSYLQPAAFALPYTATQGPGLIPDPSLFFSAGALWSNVEDLATWDAALLNGRVIPSSVFTVMVTPASVPDYPQGGPSDYAMGWVLGKAMGHPFVWHNGETYSYTAFNGMFLDDGFSVTLLTNGAVNEDTPFLNLGEQIVQGICTTAGTARVC